MSNPKNPSITSVTWNPEHSSPSWAPPLPFNFLNTGSKDTRKTCFYFHLIVESETIFDDHNEKKKHVNQYNDVHMLSV